MSFKVYSLTHWLFKNKFFSIYICVYFPVSFCFWFLVSLHCDQRKFYCDHIYVIYHIHSKTTLKFKKCENFFFFFFVKTVTICCHKYFQVCNTILLTIITMYIRSPKLTYFVIVSMCSWSNNFPFLPPPSPW